MRKQEVVKIINVAGETLYHRREGWENAECFLIEQLQKFDSPEAFAAAVWLLSILTAWRTDRRLSAGAHHAVMTYALHAQAQGFSEVLVEMIFALQRSSVFRS